MWRKRAKNTRRRVLGTLLGTLTSLHGLRESTQSKDSAPHALNTSMLVRWREIFVFDAKR
jgi:hypothetical protein